MVGVDRYAYLLPRGVVQARIDQRETRLKADRRQALPGNVTGGGIGYRCNSNCSGRPVNPPAFGGRLRVCRKRTRQVLRRSGEKYDYLAFQVEPLEIVDFQLGDLQAVSGKYGTDLNDGIRILARVQE